MTKILVGIIIVFSVSHAYAQESADESLNAHEEKVRDPCEGITCANHGICALKSDGPVCACDEGYKADPTTGLSCQPIRKPLPSIQPLLSVPSIQPLLSVVPANDSKSEMYEIERLLGARKGRLGGKWRIYEKLSDDPSFAHYMYRDFTKKRNAGIAVLTLGFVFYGGVAGFGYGAYAVSDSMDPGDEAMYVGFVAGAVICILLGTTGIILGSVVTGKGNTGRRKLKPLLEDEKQGTARQPIRFAGLSPLSSSHGSPSGVSLHFQF